MWNGAGDHLLHFTGANFTDIQGSLGFDFHLNDRIQLSATGKWTTDIFVDRVADLLAARAGLEEHPGGAVHVEDEDSESPLMLYLAYQEPHAPLMVDPKYEALYPDEDDPQRKTYLGMVSSVDDSVGRIVQLLKDYTYTDDGGILRSMYDDTVFLFRCISIVLTKMNLTNVFLGSKVSFDNNKKFSPQLRQRWDVRRSWLCWGRQ